MKYTIRHGGEEIVENIELSKIIYMVRFTDEELKSLANLSIGQSLYLSDLRVNVFRVADTPYTELFTSPLMFRDRKKP